MPSRRMIDPAIWQSESMAELTRDQRLLFIGLFSNADDQGRLRGNANLIRSIVFPFDEDVTTDKIKEDLQAIVTQDCIVIYEADGKELIQILHWWSYQSPQWAYPSKLAPPPGWYDRQRYRQDNRVITYNWKPDHSPGNDGFLPPPDSPVPCPPPPNGLAKSLPKEQGKDLAGVIELGLVIENQEEVEARAAFAQVSTFYQNEIGPLSSVISDSLLELCKEHPPDWIPLAIKAAVEQNQRKLSYVKGILNNWRAIGGPQNDKPKNGGSNGNHSSQPNRPAQGRPSPGHRTDAGQQSDDSGGIPAQVAAAFKRISRASSGGT